MEYIPTGVCSKKIDIEVEDNIIKKVSFTGGCPGNLLGISKLVIGMDAREVIDKFKGTKCGMRSTSCPDQLAKALEEIITIKS
ncbi:MAG: TIGR03905 family TSCPD domain-containing protein [Mycoplasmatota bacterium]